MATTFVKIQTVTVGAGGVTSIEFTSIPQTYTDLKIVLSGRSSAENEYYVTFNSNSANYSSRYIYGNGSSVLTGTNPFGTSFAFLGSVNKSTTTASVFNNAEIYISNYTSANHKSISANTSQENNATEAYNWLTAAIWSNTSAITSIQVDLQNAPSNFTEYSTFTLYGIKSS
jgi:hypothetical protein